MMVAAAAYGGFALLELHEHRRLQYRFLFPLGQSGIGQLLQGVRKRHRSETMDD